MTTNALAELSNEPAAPATAPAEAPQFITGPDGRMWQLRPIYDRIDPKIWEGPDTRRALARRDIATVYRRLQRFGVSQRAIAARTGQSQSEISEILAGRRVVSYDLLVRIADGLGVPRGWMGLAYDRATVQLLGSKVES